MKVLPVVTLDSDYRLVMVNLKIKTDKIQKREEKILLRYLREQEKESFYVENLYEKTEEAEYKQGYVNIYLVLWKT